MFLRRASLIDVPPWHNEAQASSDRRLYLPTVPASGCCLSRGAGRDKDTDRRKVPLREHVFLPYLGARPPSDSGPSLHLFILQKTWGRVDLESPGRPADFGARPRASLKICIWYPKSDISYMRSLRRRPPCHEPD